MSDPNTPWRAAFGHGSTPEADAAMARMVGRADATALVNKIRSGEQGQLLHVLKAYGFVQGERLAGFCAEIERVIRGDA